MRLIVVGAAAAHVQIDDCVSHARRESPSSFPAKPTGGSRAGCTMMENPPHPHHLPPLLSSLGIHRVGASARDTPARQEVATFGAMQGPINPCRNQLRRCAMPTTGLRAKTTTSTRQHLWPAPPPPPLKITRAY